MPLIGPGKVVDAFPGLGRPPAEVGRGNAMDDTPLDENLEVGSLRIKTDELGLALPQHGQESG